jgi:hypothetical protein
MVHLYVMDKILNHLKTYVAFTLKCYFAQLFFSLIESTTVEEPNEVYITKLAIAIGRSKCRVDAKTVESDILVFSVYQAETRVRTVHPGSPPYA